jgi:hypothetical protein
VITITDVQGKPVYESTVAKGKDADKRIDLSAESKGVYFVKVKTSTDSKTEKLVLQ